MCLCVVGQFGQVNYALYNKYSNSTCATRPDELLGQDLANNSEHQAVCAERFLKRWFSNNSSWASARMLQSILSFRCAELCQRLLRYPSNRRLQYQHQYFFGRHQTDRKRIHAFLGSELCSPLSAPLQRAGRVEELFGTTGSQLGVCFLPHISLRWLSLDQPCELCTLPQLDASSEHHVNRCIRGEDP